MSLGWGCLFDQWQTWGGVIIFAVSKKHCKLKYIVDPLKPMEYNQLRFKMLLGNAALVGDTV